MKQNMRLFIIVPIYLLSLIATSQANADWVIEQEHIERWDGGGISPSMVRGAELAINDVVIEDINGDGIREIITIGAKDSDTHSQVAELKISTWNGTVFTILAERTWGIDENQPTGRAVYSGDIDGDGAIEIITATTEVNDGTNSLELKTWRWSATEANLTEITSRRWDNYFGTSIDGGDVDGDGTVEIVIGGQHHVTVAGEELRLPNFKVVRLEGTEFVEEYSMDIETTRSGRPVLVAIGDVNSRPGLEIVTVSKYSLRYPTSQLKIWQWNGESPIFLGEAEGEDTNFEDVVLANMDTDGLLEIITVGRELQGEDPSASIGVVSIWNDDEDSPFELLSRYTWTDETGSNTFFHCLTVGNIAEDADNKMLVGGYSYSDTSSQRILVVFEFNRMSWEVPYNYQWSEGHGGKVYEVVTEDLERDGQVEIVTVGNSYDLSRGDVWADNEVVLWRLSHTISEPTVEEPPRRFFWPPGAFIDTLPIAWRYVVYAVASIIVVVLCFVALRVVFSLVRNLSDRDEGPMSG